MMSTWRIILLSLVFLGVVGLAMCAAVVFQPAENKKGGNGYKRLSGTVAEGFVYRVGGVAHPLVTCGACRVGKVKLGMVSLGGFNTIEFDDLVVNVPEAGWKADGEDKTVKDVKAGANSDTDAVVNAFNLKPVMAMAHAEGKRFSGIRITKFQLNKMSGNELRPIMKAATLKNSGKRLLFHDAVLYMDGRQLHLAEVELLVRPKVMLTWDTGSWNLTDFTVK